jgi:hypothetical protein
LLGLSWAAPAAHAQLKLAAEEFSFTTTTITPADPTVLETNQSPEIMAVDIPAVPSAGYVLFTRSGVWQVNTTADAPVRGVFFWRFDFSSPALLPGMVLHAFSPMTNFRHSNNGSDESFEGGSASGEVVLTRQTLAGFLQSENPIDAATALQIADGFFQQGFHVSVSAQLTSRNITSAALTNPGVDFFMQDGSN